MNKYFRLFTGILICGSIFSSCAEKFNVGNEVDEDGYLAATQQVVGIRNEDGKALFTNVEIIGDNTTVNFYVESSKPAASAIDAVVTIADESYVDEYNAKYGTSYIAYPAAGASIQSGQASITQGQKKSQAVEMQITADASLNQDFTYMIPLEVTSKSANSGKMHYVLVKDYRGQKFASSEKPSGIKLISCMEVGQTSPLFHKSFLLQNSRLPLFDYVILFSAKIEYDTDQCKLVVANPTGVDGTLRSGIVQELHDMGMKVLVSILGSTYAGVAHLTDEACKTYAQELANYCEAHELDGVFFDDEYTSYWDYPGLTSPSRERAARLCYETKMAMPDKLVTCYMYTNTYGFYDAIEGVEPGDFVDYGINDYGRWYDETYYLGMERSQIAPGSANFAEAYARWTATPENLQRVRDEGYGAFMVYCLTANQTVWSKELESLQNIAQYLYDDVLVDTGYRPECTW
ncbi:MAG: DUF1735 domain-containing protein [Bacteroidales bacterium]|nr:DUF1735 domain-containing protein [Bacteroidales bacterium]MBQ3612989.1 DUF1735 domain-containing protein [Bacteroidales bacterium]